LEKSLTQTLNNSELIGALIDNINSMSERVTFDNDLILSARQGHSIQSNIALGVHPNAFSLQLYMDGISVTNPIGAKKESHKFTCFYYILDDLPNIVRSQVQAVALHALCYTKTLADETSRTIVFETLTRDLNTLFKCRASVFYAYQVAFISPFPVYVQIIWLLTISAVSRVFKLRKFLSSLFYYI